MESIAGHEVAEPFAPAFPQPICFYLVQQQPQTITLGLRYAIYEHASCCNSRANWLWHSPRLRPPGRQLVLDEGTRRLQTRRRICAVGAQDVRGELEARPSRVAVDEERGARRQGEVHAAGRRCYG